MMNNENLSGGELVVKCLEALGTEYIFGLPGAKVDNIFDALVDSKIRLILCRHEQNAAFMASSYASITGKPGVIVVTSGPGITNLATGLLTATTEGYPLIAIGANVKQSMQQRSTHQSLENQQLMLSICKSSVEIHAIENIPETISNAYRKSLQSTPGAAFISIPQDILIEKTSVPPLKHLPLPPLGTTHPSFLDKVAQTIKSAKRPVLFLGMTAPKDPQIYDDFLNTFPMPVVETFQATGLISKSHLNKFAGRVGLFKNQPGDHFLQQSDLIITVGFNPIEYDPEIWSSSTTPIIHINDFYCSLQQNYQPTLELIGDTALHLKHLASRPIQMQMPNAFIDEIHKKRTEQLEELNQKSMEHPQGIHPLKFIESLQGLIDDRYIICCDIGSVYIWMARYFYVHKPNHLLFSNGQQTLGVGLPWAMGACLAEPNAPVISLSGDGGFLFSATELETAMREKMKFIHFIWTDGSYDMVKEQAIMKYGRANGVDLLKIDIISFAKAFGAQGFILEKIEDLPDIFAKALESPVPVLIDVKIDYQDNPYLFTQIHEDFHD